MESPSWEIHGYSGPPKGSNGVRRVLEELTLEGVVVVGKWLVRRVHVRDFFASACAGEHA
jgi:hypothetical protein